MFPTTKSLTFFLIIVKTDLENKVIRFQFEPGRSIFNHERFYQDSGDEGDAIEPDMFHRKDRDPSVSWKCRNCSTMKTKKECEVEAVRGLNLQGIFVLSQAIILAELNYNLMISISICFCNKTWFQNPCHI